MAEKGKSKKAKSNAGRPPSITPIILGKLEHAFSAGCSDIEACLFAGISKTTLYKYQQENPEFTDRKAALKENLKMISKMNMMGSISNGDVADSKWYLERKAKDEFSTKSESDTTLRNPDGTGLLQGVNFVGIEVAAGAASEDTGSNQ